MSKKIFLLIAIVGATVFYSCEGPEGPRGATGYSAESEVFEVTTTFIPDANPEFAYRSFYNLNPEILPSDNILVYELSGVTNNGNDIWKLLPQVYTFTQGIMQYNYDFTIYDFSIFIDANFDRSTLNPSWTQNKTFRIVIVPGYFSNKVDVNNFEAVKKELKVTDKDFKHLTEKSK